MALQIHFFMAPEDERDLFRRLERHEVELWPEYTEPSYEAPLVRAELADALDAPAYYFAAGPVEGYVIKRGKDRGLWKVDEVKSPVIYFSRSVMEDGELRAGYFWAESESAGDNSRLGGKPGRFHNAVRGLQEIVRSRFRKSTPVAGSTYFVGQAAGRLSQQGTKLRERGRKGQLVVPYR